MSPKSLDELAKEAEDVSSKIDEKIQSIKRRNKRIKTGIFTTLFFLTSLTTGYLGLIHFPRKKVEKEIQDIIYLANNNNFYEADELSENLQSRLQNKGILNSLFDDLYERVVNYDKDIINPRILQLKKIEEYTSRFDDIKNLIKNKDYRSAYSLFVLLEKEVKKENFKEALLMVRELNSYYSKNIDQAIRTIKLFDSTKERILEIVNDGIADETEVQTLNDLQSSLVNISEGIELNDRLIEEKRNLENIVFNSIEKYNYETSRIEFYKNSFENIRNSLVNLNESQINERIKSLADTIEQERILKASSIYGGIKDFTYLREVFVKDIYEERLEKKVTPAKYKEQSWRDKRRYNILEGLAAFFEGVTSLELPTKTKQVKVSDEKVEYIKVPKKVGELYQIFKINPYSGSRQFVEEYTKKIEQEPTNVLKEFIKK